MTRESWGTAAVMQRQPVRNRRPRMVVYYVLDRHDAVCVVPSWLGERKMRGYPAPKWHRDAEHARRVRHRIARVRK